MLRGMLSEGGRGAGAGGKKGSPFMGSVNESLHFGSRPLLTPREVMELSDEEALVLVGGGRPIKAKKIRYFDDRSFAPLLQAPPQGQMAGISDSSDEWIRTCYEAVPQAIEPPREVSAGTGEHRSDSERYYERLQPDGAIPAGKVLRHPAMLHQQGDLQEQSEVGKVEMFQEERDLA